jgi:hypothetical protein
LSPDKIAKLLDVIRNDSGFNIYRAVSDAKVRLSSAATATFVLRLGDLDKQAIAQLQTALRFGWPPARCVAQRRVDRRSRRSRTPSALAQARKALAEAELWRAQQQLFTPVWANNPPTPAFDR